MAIITSRTTVCKILCSVVALIVGLCEDSRAVQSSQLSLDCEFDAAWSGFREKLVINAATGFPLDSELLEDAQGLLQQHWIDIVPDPEAAYGASQGMQSFFASCNTPPSTATSKPPFCLYGAVAALWVVAKSGHPNAHALLEHAAFLLGSSMNFVLDFMESSRWPLSSIDILANVQRPTQEIRSPIALHHYTTPAQDYFWKRDRSPNVTVLVWEIGVHASLSAEPLQMWARFIPRAEFLHRNLIQDQYPLWLPDRCETLYSHARLSCDSLVDELTQLFRRHIPHSATSKEPIEDIDTLSDEFESMARPVIADSVDMFLCTVAYLCLIVGGFGVPVLGYFGHPLLFMVPQNEVAQEIFWSRFVDMLYEPHIEFAVSDPFLEMQFEYQVGLPKLPVIRTHALYIGATHYPARAGEVLVVDRPHECVLMCIIRHLLPASSYGSSEDWPVADGRLRAAASDEYPFRFITRQLTDRRFSTFAQFRATVLYPYDMDLITFYEFYSMNMPIFMPSHLPKYLFHQGHMAYNGQWRSRRKDAGSLWPSESDTPFNETSLDSVQYTVTFTDYFRFPAVQHFNSIAEMLKDLPDTNFFEVVQAMATFNQKSLVESAEAWRTLMKRATGWDADLFQP